MDIERLLKIDPKILTIGSHPPIIQSVLDFDFISGKKEPSITCILASGRKFERYFFGRKEIFIPVFESFDRVPSQKKKEISAVLNVSSGRRAFASTIEAFDLPGLLICAIFAENVPEKQAIELITRAREKSISVIGPASVGLLIPGHLKLGAIGGTEYNQIVSSRLDSRGSVCVVAASGGMVNEIISIVTQKGYDISFATHVGGDRYPIVSPAEVFQAAEKDKNTETIVYYGELGGEDEYVLAELIKKGAITKPVICYIAGVISDLFEEAPQFGHAKAMAKNRQESASAKREALKKAGARVGGSFAEFVDLIGKLEASKMKEERDYSTIHEHMTDRKHALIASSVSKDEQGDVKILGQDLLPFAQNNSFAKIALSMFLGKEIISKETEELADFIFRISVDHGPYVSGAVNTIVTARAGRDMVSSLSTGLLTIGPRFGGAVNEAAKNWLEGVLKGIDPNQFVENFAKEKKYIQGIGHRKYRIDFPDPRVGELKKFADALSEKRFLNFALHVEKVTSAKKGNLILNVDGTIAALMLDYLSEKEKYSDEKLREIADTEFFNALFVLPRSVGFIAHYLDQKRLDEGLFRLEEEHVADANTE